MIASLFSSEPLLPDIWVPSFEIKIDEKPLSEEVAKLIQHIEIKQDLGQPDTFSFQLSDSNTIQLKSPKLKLVNKGGLFTEGKKIAISMGYLGKQEKKRILLSGRISAISVSFPSNGSPTIQVEGFSDAHQLTYGTHNRLFDTSKSDSEIVKEIADKAGLSASVDDTRPRKEPRIQHGITNWQFLTNLALANGYFVWVADSTLYFKKTPPKSEQTITLEYGKTLLSFNPRFSTAELVSEVIVRGWDPIQKQNFKSQPEKLVNYIPDQLAAAAKKVIDDGSGKPSQRIITNAPVSSEMEAQTYAKAVAHGIANRFITGDGTSVGDSRIKVATQLNLKGIGRFEGNYLVSSVTHTLSDSGYQTSFGVNRAADNSDFSIEGQRRGEDHPRQYGVMIGLVISNQDPEKLGRVKVKFPGWSDDETGHWARITVPMAGAERGIFFLPEVKDEVLVAFEQGEMSRPYIVGALWNGKDKPPSTNADGQNNIRLIQSRSGSVIRFDDTAGAETIAIQDKSGQNSITIDITNGAIAITSAQDINIEAAKGTIKLSALNIEITSTASAKIEAKSDLTLKASGQTNVEGAIINLN